MFAVVVYALFTGLNFFVQPVTGGRVPLLPYFPALVLTGLCAGSFPASALLVAATFTVSSLWIRPSGSFGVAPPEAFIILVLFFIAGCMIAFVSGWARYLVLQARRSRERLNQALEAGRMTTWDWNLSNNKLAFSGGGVALFGTEPTTLDASWPLVHSDDVQLVREQVDAAIKAGRDFKVLSRIISKSGDFLWLQSFGRVHKDEAGKAARVTGVSVDVSERQAALEGSRDAEARLHVALEAGKVSAWECDAQRRYTWAYNPPRGLTPFDLIGHRIGEANESDGFISASERVYATGEETTFALEIIYQGDVRHYMCYLRAEMDRNGKVSRVIGASVDVTELQNAQEKVRLESKRKDTFLATLAHELRNPLAPIRYAAALVGDNATSAQRQKAQAVINRQSAHMTRLIDDLLDISRISRNAITLQRRVFDLRISAEQAAEMMQPALTEKKHRLVLCLPTEPLLVDGDPARLQQVLGNLLDNAAKYTAPGGEVTLRLNQDAGEAVMSVQDNGVGIEPASQGEVFGMFVQLSEPGRGQGGLGIGLAVVQQLVILHGGSVSVRSGGPGKGSEFIVRVPLSTQANSTAHGDNVVALFRSSDKVLVVDDNRDTADSLSMLLREEGITVSTAYNGGSALDVYEKIAPAVVLLDIGLPDMSGHEVAKAIRGRSDDVVLIAITGWGQEKDQAASIAAGFDFHMVKPVDPQVLRSRLGQVLSKRRAG